MADQPLAPQVYKVSEEPPIIDLLQPQTDYADTYQGTNTPLVIDFGSWRCRAGWAAAIPEQPALNFENAVAKYKDRRSNQAKQSVVVGDDLYADLAGRLTVKPSFDGGAICNSEPFESVLDYTLLQLGIQTDRVYHPILMTEPLCAPFYHRKLVSELLFEGYGAPSVIYGVDSLYSHHHNGSDTSSDALIISAGHTSTQLIPYVDGRARLDMSKRLTFGGNQCVEEMLKLMQLKYPTFPTKVTPYHASYMVHNHTYFATNYRAELQAYRGRDFLTTHDRVIQFPYTVVVPETKSEEEIERLASKRREQMKRMQEIAAKNRLDKLMRNEEDLDTFTKLKLGKKQDSKAAFLEKLKSAGFRNEVELDQEVKRLEASIEKAHNKDLGVDKTEEKPPHCPLLEVPDEDLSEADKKEKRKQRLLKAGFDARERARHAKEEARIHQEEQAQKDEEWRLSRPNEWLDALKAKRLELKSKMQKREQLKQQLADRRSHASQLRMKSISALAAADGTTPLPGVSPSTSATSAEVGSAAVGAAGRRRKRGPTEDTFGADDSDWAVYREISKEEGSDEEEEEENDQVQLIQYEELLRKHDPKYLDNLVRAEKARIQKNVMYQFTRGVSDVPDPDSPDETAQQYQLHLNVERIKVPEMLFQPSIIGIEQAGLLEVMDHTLCQLSSQHGVQIRKFFVTGGSSLIPNLSNRLQVGIRSLLPVGSPFEVIQARDPVLDAWRGAAQWAHELQATNAWNQYAVTRADYDECGPQYLKEHPMGNRFYQPQ